MDAAHAEVEIKFIVPAASRAALAAELGGRGTTQRRRLADSYVDTPDLRLARAGLAWRLRRDGGRWLQALKAAGGGPLARFEHEVVRPDAHLDPEAHAGTAPGRALLALLREAEADGQPAGERCRAELQRLSRRVRTRDAVVEVVLDEGRLQAGDAVLRLREVEFELVSGSPLALLALAERWRLRFGLIHDPRSKAERGLRLAAGAPHAPPRQAALPCYAADADAAVACTAVVDECLAHIGRNAIGLVDGDPAMQVEQVHQLRVGIRRLRCALRAFRGWVAAPPDGLAEGLRRLFADLGRLRDRDVLGSGVATELAAAGAPPLAPPAPGGGRDATALAAADETQRLLLACIAWRTGLADGPAPAEPPHGLQRLARERLRRWQRRIARACEAFDTLDAAGLHALRKRVKRQRYALEFFAPLLPRRRAARHLQALAAAQQRLGEINDVVVARNHYQALVATEPAAWFAVGWLTARLAQARAAARGDLGRLAALAPLKR